MKRELAAAFVVISVTPGCKKMMAPPEPEATVKTAGIFRTDTGTCELLVPMSCPKNATCNPPEPEIVDCPASQRDAGDPPATTARPPGKEDWIRVRPHLYVSDARCQYAGEWYCAPPGKAFECTASPGLVNVACSALEDDAGVDAAADAGAKKAKSFRVEPFVYKDGLGNCHRTPLLTCAPGDCPLPEGDPAPCP